MPDLWCHPLQAQHPASGRSSCPAAVDGDMVEQRREPHPLLFRCCFTHTGPVAPLADPALSPERGGLPRVLSGRLPSLHALRRGCPPLFGPFDGSTQPSDSHRRACWTPGSCTSPTSPARRLFAKGTGGVSRFSRVELPCMPEVSDCADSADACGGAPAGIAFRHADRGRHSGRGYFAVPYPACMCPLLTLRWQPRGWPRMTRGQDGPLRLSCVTLSFTNSTPVYPGALHNLPGGNTWLADATTRSPRGWRRGVPTSGMVSSLACRWTIRPSRLPKIAAMISASPSRSSRAACWARLSDREDGRRPLSRIVADPVGMKCARP